MNEIWVTQHDTNRKLCQVINLHTSKTIVGHFVLLVAYPRRLRLTGYLNISNIQIIPAFGCSRHLQVDWTGVMFSNNMEHVINSLQKDRS